MSKFQRVMLRGLIACSVILSCGSNKPVEPKGKMLPLVASYRLSIAEPSGLTLDDTRTILWTVTNNPDRVYQLDLQGKVTKTLSYAGRDLEGIAYDPSDQTLWVCEEARRELVQLDLDGAVLARKGLGLSGEPNSGLEGLCLDDQGNMFALNEKNPGLFLELGADLTISSQLQLNFAGDYSGLAYHAQEGKFWVVSDKSEKLYLWEKSVGVVDEWSFPFSKAEGIAFDEAEGLIYVVSDSENTLYVYRLE